MKKMKVTFFEDPQHGWLAVKRKALEQLGIEKEISGCSYQRGETVYLEEDCDAGKFMKAYAEKMGVSTENWQEMKAQLFDMKKSHTNNSSPVRSYAGYNPERRAKLEVGMEIKLYGKYYRVVGFDKGLALVSSMSENGMRYRMSKTQMEQWTKA